jgi:hypothetical protein
MFDEDQGLVNEPGTFSGLFMAPMEAMFIRVALGENGLVSSRGTTMISPRLLVHSAAAGTLCALFYCAVPTAMTEVSSSSEPVSTSSAPTAYALYDVPSSIDREWTVPSSQDYTVRVYRTARVYGEDVDERARRRAEYEAWRQEQCRRHRARALEQARQRFEHSIEQAREDAW